MHRHLDKWVDHALVRLDLRAQRFDHSMFDTMKCLVPRHTPVVHVGKTTNTNMIIKDQRMVGYK